GLVPPSEGEIHLDGTRVWFGDPSFLRKVGYVPEEPHLYSYLTGPEYLRLVGRLHSIPHSLLEFKIDGLLKAFALSDARYNPISDYSKGMRQKILLSAALLHDPEILILDETFSGLDVGAYLLLRSLLVTFAKLGKMILYSSHVLEVVEKICTEVVILHKGRMVAYDSVAHLRELQASPSLESVFAQLTIAEDNTKQAENIVEVMTAR